MLAEVAHLFVDLNGATRNETRSLPELVAHDCCNHPRTFGVIEVDQRLVEDAAKLAIDRELRSLGVLHLAAALMLPGRIFSFPPGTAASALLPVLKDSRSLQKGSTDRQPCPVETGCGTPDEDGSVVR
jgi:hypothetical protein